MSVASALVVDRIMSNKRPKAKYPKGRTTHDATCAGDYFEITDDAGRVVLSPPGCGSPEEVLWWAVYRRFARPGVAYGVQRHLPGSTIGCTIVEACGTIRMEA